MTPKEKALKDTVNKFTNLLDGQVKYGVTVRGIINYYESKLNNEPVEIPKSTDGIMHVNTPIQLFPFTFNLLTLNVLNNLSPSFHTNSSLTLSLL